MAATRSESDSLGAIEVPADRYWGAQTERARRNFPISGQRLPRRFIAALALIKREAARVNGELGRIDAALVPAIVAAAQEIVDGRHPEEFPLDVFQTGSGTSTNMNLNEVIANRASELLGGGKGGKHPVHPNDHVNASQSSNDTIPSAIHVAGTLALVSELQPALGRLQRSLAAKAAEFGPVVKVGRTHLQDAVPMRLGQEFSGYAQQIAGARARVDACMPRLRELALGGTAVGTGLNAPPGFAGRVIAGLAAATGQPFVPAPNRFEAIAARDAVVETSGALKTCAVSLTKIANDLRLLGSGPRCGLGELVLPSLQPGSSIMPGKVNPVIPEAVLMVAAQVIGNDTTITIAGASGTLELNVMMPLLAHNFLQSIEILTTASTVFATACIDGLRADDTRARDLVERSLAMATALVPRLGYDAAAELARSALASGQTVREVARERRVLEDSELDSLLDPGGQTGESG